MVSDLVAQNVTAGLASNAICTDPENSFYFIRHGRTDWNKEMLELGPQDLSLNNEGIAEVRSVLHLLREIGIKRIISSPLQRCIETAEIISKSLGGIPVIIEPALSERYFGNWSMQKNEAELLKRQSGNGPEFFANIKHKIEGLLPADAESKETFKDRVLDYFYCSGFSEGKVLIVSHGCVFEQLKEYIKLTEDTVGKKRYATPILLEKKTDGSWGLHLAR